MGCMGLNRLGRQDCRKMRWVIALCSILFVNSAFAVPAVVDYIFDGDTFAGRVMLDDDIEITVRVRLIDVDTPEIHGRCESEIEMAGRARDRLTELLPVGSVIVISAPCLPSVRFDALIVPPCILISVRQRFSPMPVPADFVPAVFLPW